MRTFSLSRQLNLFCFFIIIKYVGIWLEISQQLNGINRKNTKGKEPGLDLMRECQLATLPTCQFSNPSLFLGH